MSETVFTKVEYTLDTLKADAWRGRRPPGEVALKA